MLNQNNHEFMAVNANKLIHDYNLKPTSTPGLYGTESGDRVKINGGTAIVNGNHSYTDNSDIAKGGRLKK
jgi:hypothetical protein